MHQPQRQIEAIPGSAEAGAVLDQLRHLALTGIALAAYIPPTLRKRLAGKRREGIPHGQ